MKTILIIAGIALLIVIVLKWDDINYYLFGEEVFVEDLPPTSANASVNTSSGSYAAQSLGMQGYNNSGNSLAMTSRP